MINEKNLTEVNYKYIITVDKRFSLIDTRRLRFGDIGGAFYKTFYDCGLIFHKTDDIENAAKVFAGIQND